MNEKGDLVRLLDLDSDFIIELRYASPDNFTGQIIYTSNECYINKHTAKLLIQAKNIFRSDGFCVKIWDAYRPIRAQKRFYEILPDPNFVAPPPDMSKLTKFRATHLNGLCVDLTLVDLDGNEIEMPSEFDNFTEKASLSCNTISNVAKENALYLRQVMERVGFEGYEYEWWHFYDRRTPPTAFLDFPI